MHISQILVTCHTARSAVLILMSVYVVLRRFSLHLGHSHELHSPILDVYEPFPIVSTAAGLPRITMDERGRYQRLLSMHPGGVVSSDGSIDKTARKGSRYGKRVWFDHINQPVQHVGFGPGEREWIDMGSLKRKDREADREASRQGQDRATTTGLELLERDLAYFDAAAYQGRRSPRSYSGFGLRKSAHRALSLSSTGTVGRGLKKPKLASPSPLRASFPVILVPTAASGEQEQEEENAAEHGENVKPRRRPANLAHLHLRSPASASFTSALSPLNSGIRLRSPVLLTLEEGTRFTSKYKSSSWEDEAVLQATSPVKRSHHVGTSPKSPCSPRSPRSPCSPHSPLSPRAFGSQRHAASPLSPRSPAKTRFANVDKESTIRSPRKSVEHDEGFASIDALLSNGKKEEEDALL